MTDFQAGRCLSMLHLNYKIGGNKFSSILAITKIDSLPQAYILNRLRVMIKATGQFDDAVNPFLARANDSEIRSQQKLNSPGRFPRVFDY